MIDDDLYNCSCVFYTEISECVLALLCTIIIEDQKTVLENWILFFICLIDGSYL